MMGLKERVMELEFQMRPKGIDHDRIYTAIMQIEHCTGVPVPDETEEEWMIRFLETHGSREKFIEDGKLREERRHGL
jgi:hypothetical protein